MYLTLLTFSQNDPSFHFKWKYKGGTHGKEPSCQCRRHERCGFDTWVKKISWRRQWQQDGLNLQIKSVKAKISAIRKETQAENKHSVSLELYNQNECPPSSLRLQMTSLIIQTGDALGWRRRTIWWTDALRKQGIGKAGAVGKVHQRKIKVS